MRKIKKNIYYFLHFIEFLETKDQFYSSVHLITASNNDFITTPGSVAPGLCARVRPISVYKPGMDDLLHC